MIVYIAGPITSDPDYEQKFDAVAKEVAKMGFFPINPANQPEGRPYREYIDNGLDMLRRADAAIFLDGWQKSHGAQLEYNYCTTVDIPCVCYGCHASWKTQLKIIAQSL